jgi:putative photosynthetic complex assembly protein
MALASTPFIPRAVLWGAALLMLTTFLAATIERRTAGEAESDGPTAMLRELHFADRGDGGVDVIDAASGRVIEVLQGEQGFVRGVLRGLAQERLRRGGSRERPFLLVLSGSGRLALIDPVSNRRVDLESFGRDNAATFARWLGEPGMRL